MVSPLFSTSLRVSSRTALRQPSFSQRCFHTSRTALDIYKDVSKEKFTQLLSAAKENKRILVVDFHADWCGPCKLLGPVLEKAVNDPQLAESKGLAFDLATVDTDSVEGIEVSTTYAVKALPTVIAFKDGEPVNKFVGAINEVAVRQFLQTL